MNVVAVDLTDRGVVIYFKNGTGVFFDAEFLYGHRKDNGNKILSKERVIS